MTPLTKMFPGKPVTISDGATGTYLEALGYRGDCPERADIERPELVERLHRDYAEAGARVLLTNTFGANRIRLAHRGLQDRMADIHVSAVASARAVKNAFPGTRIAGDIGAIGELLEPYGTLTVNEAADMFREQAGYLANAGVDFLLLETFSDLEEMKIACGTLRDAFALPVLPSFSLSRGKEYRTIMGQTIEQIVAWCTSEGLDMLGFNCGVSSAQMVEIAQQVRALTSIPLWLKPNAGSPAVAGGAITYPESPAEFADRCLDIVACGVSCIGGCCGTDPSYIREIARRLVPPLP